MSSRGVVRCVVCVAVVGRSAGGFWGPQKATVPRDGLSCDEGYRAVGPEAIDDGYCDCVDGADEPSTSACASVHSRASFRCVNEGFESRWVASSRVGDGVCDCCDGTDEAGGECEHTCDSEAAAARAEAERVARERAAGLEKRAAYVAQWAETTASRAADAADAEREKTEASALVEALRPRVEAHDAREAAARAEAVAAAETAYAAAVDELFREAPDHEIRVAAVRLATAAADVETLLDVVMHSAGLDDAITDAIDDVEVLSLGVDAAEAYKAGDAAKFDEICAAVAAALKLDAVPAAAAKTVALETARAAKLDPAAQPTGLADKLAALPAPDAPENLAATDESRADRDALRDAQDRVKDAERRLAGLGKTTSRDLGPDEAFGPIQDACFKARANKYDYELCLFAKAKQDFTSIGTFAEWDEDYTLMRYKHGQHCAGIGSREFTVRLLCGDTEQLLDVLEAQTCKYEATFKTPAACR